MSWMLSISVATALLALCRGENTVNEGNSLSPSGYHLCIHNETRNVSFLAVHKVPYTVTRLCGGWVPLMTCTVKQYRMIHQTEFKTVDEPVIRCCDGYVQVGRYCALPVNRSGEFTAKPGSCPTADGLYPESHDCEWDIDCPGWQKCCRTSNHSLCSNPAIPTNYSKNGGYRLNATVTVKTDYELLMSNDRGHLNHTRLLQAMVTGALESNFTAYYLSSWPVHPYRTATSLLIYCDFPLSLYNVTSKLHLLLKHIQEVSSVTVEDVDECAHLALRQCSPMANCNNTVGSYHCTCFPGYVDVDPRNPGAHCTADVTTPTLLTDSPPVQTTYTPPSNATQDPRDYNTTGLFSSTETSTTAALSNISSVPYNSSHAPQWTSSASSTSMSPTTTCSIPSITSVWSANVTGTSFCVYWSSQFQMNQTYLVVVSNASGVMYELGTNQAMMEVTGLQPGVLYNVTVTPCACGSQGNSLRTSVRTDAQTLDATARFTNIEFTADLNNTDSQAYKNLSESITVEILLGLSPELRAMVDSGQVRIEIRGFSPGSVVVNFTLIFIPSQSQDIRNVSTTLLKSLSNSTKYTVDKNSTRINDFDECASGENDCSQLANCTNSWGSYTCECKEAFIDNNPGRPGRTCQVIPILETTMATILPTATATSLSQITNTTSDPVTQTAVPFVTTAQPNTTSSTAATTGQTPTTTRPTSATNATTTSSTTSTTTTIAPIHTTSTTATTTPTTTSPTITTATTTTITAPTHTTTTPTTTTTTVSTTTTTTLTTTATTPTTRTTTPTITATTPTTTATTPTTRTTTPTTTATTSMTTSTTSTTRATTPTITTTTPTTTATTPTTRTTTPTITTTTPTTTATTPTTRTTTPTITATTPTTTATTPTTRTTTPTTTTITPTTTTPAMASTASTTITIPPTNATAPRNDTHPSMPGAISVQCRVASITAAVAKDFLQKNNIIESALYLGLPACGVNGSNATHAQLTVSWTECGVTLVHNDTHYMATVKLYNSMDQYVSANRTMEPPKMRLEVPITCVYTKSMLISADSGSMGYDMIKDVIMGSGSFQVKVQLMNGTVPLPYNYSLSPEEAVVVDVSLNTSSDQIKVVINKCWATPTLNPVDSSSKVFLENSCPVRPFTKVLMNGNSSTSRVSVQIFSIVDVNVIYLHCEVQICLEFGSDSCVPDCQQRTSRSNKALANSFGTAGPLRKSEEEALEEGFDTLHIVGLACLGIGLSLFFIIGFVCLFYYQRNRIGHYNFSVKPKQENFTYLVFNT